VRSTIRPDICYRNTRRGISTGPGAPPRVSNGYIGDASDRPIEGAGNIPDVRVEPAISDLVNGRDPVLERAILTR
jgi:hypothetical protein